MHVWAVPRLLLLLLAGALLIAGCAVPTAQVSTLPTQTSAPTQAATQAPTATDAVETPTLPVTPLVSTPEAVGADSELVEFKAALLQALMAQDREQLLARMTEPFLTGGWRADGSDSSPAEALEQLYREYLGSENRLEWVEDADLYSLLGDKDPLAFPRSEAGVIDVSLLSGLGKDGRDEAGLFISRQADGSLKWHGWLYIPGGISGARLGGLQRYENEEYGYRVYLPADYEVLDENPANVLVLAPGEGHPGEERAAAFISVEPAGGRSVVEITEQFKADLGPGFDIAPGTALGLDKTMAIVLGGLPGQDSNRQLFAVYNDLLYNIYFVPDNPVVGEPYSQMEDLYAQIVNTFHFTN